MKEKVIQIDSHAFIRLLSRSEQYGLSLEEANAHVFETVRRGNISGHKHISANHITYCSYFPDNLSFYVICEEKECEEDIQVLVKTIIIERGRE